MTARFPSVVDLGANDEPQVNVSRHDIFSHSEMPANKIDGASDAVQAVASATLAAKADKIPQPTPWTDTVKENHELVKQNHALAVIIQDMKIWEDRTSYWYKELEKTCDALYLDIRRQCNRIEDLEAWLANNQAELISELRDTITTMEDAVDAASWTELRQNQEIRRLEEMVDSKNILEMEESLAQLKECNFLLSAENCNLYDVVGRLLSQISKMWSCHPGMKSKMDYPPSKDTTSCATCPGETTGEENYLSDDNSSLFPSSGNDGSI
jgi:hypothetical protein